MAPTYSFEGVCPVCGEAMIVSRFSCRHCGSAVEGTFSPAGTPAGAPAHRQSGPLGARGGAEARFGRLARLEPAQLEFVEAFLRCRGIIKNVEDMLGISYPTVKSRLATVLEAMGFSAEEGLPAAERRQMRREILADLTAGRISTEEAHQLLARAQVAPDEVAPDEGESEG